MAIASILQGLAIIFLVLTLSSTIDEVNAQREDARELKKIVMKLGDCKTLMESRVRASVLNHPVWDGVIDVMHIEPPYSNEYESGFDAAFNRALGAIQSTEVPE